MVLLSQHARDSLRNYKYSCIDDSPFGKYVTHPFWNWAVQFFPKKLAPNVITLIGFIFTLIHYLLLWYINPDFNKDAQISSLVLFLVALFVFLSHTFDGVDGKQARRTKSSSALGELFDHGIDAWTTLFISNSFLSICGKSLTPLERILGQITIAAGFTVCHWEKYLTGTLILPWLFDIFQIALSACLLAFSIFGYSPQIDVVIGATFKYVLCFYWLLLLPYYLVRGILLSREKRPDILRYFTPFIDITLVSLLTIAYVTHSNGDIMRKNPRWILYALGTTSAHVMARILVAQLTNERLRVFTPVSLTYAFWVVCAWIAGHHLQHYEIVLINQIEVIFIKLCCGLVTWMHLSYVVRLINEICETLNISAFRISSDSSIPSKAKD